MPFKDHPNNNKKKLFDLGKKLDGRAYYNSKRPETEKLTKILTHSICLMIENAVLFSFALCVVW